MIIALVVVAIAWGVSIYNGLVSKQEGVEKAIGNYRQRSRSVPI